jgi:hypothetical protein
LLCRQILEQAGVEHLIIGPLALVQTPMLQTSATVTLETMMMVPIALRVMTLVLEDVPMVTHVAIAMNHADLVKMETLELKNVLLVDMVQSLLIQLRTRALANVC